MEIEQLVYYLFLFVIGCFGLFELGRVFQEIITIRQELKEIDQKIEEDLARLKEKVGEQQWNG